VLFAARMSVKSIAKRRHIARFDTTTYNRKSMTLSSREASAIGLAPAPTHGDARDAGGTPCFHCALPVTDPGRYRVKVDGRWQPVCCPGCEAVAAAILGYGLQGYYEQRTSPAVTAGIGGENEDFRIYDDPEVQRGFVHTAATGECDAALMLEGIRCTACVWLNQSMLGRLPGVLGVGINATTHR